MKITKREIRSMTFTVKGRGVPSGYAFHCGVRGVLFERPLGHVVTYVTTFNPETGKPIMRILQETRYKTEFVDAIFDYFNS